MRRSSFFALLLAAVAAGPALALEYTWGPVNDVLDGCWTNVLHWTYPYGNALPDKSGWGSASAKIDNRASYTVSLPTATQLVAATELTMNVEEGETLVLNARDRGLLLGNQGKWQETYFGGNPIQFNAHASQLFQLYAESSTDKYDDMLELTNTVVTLTAGAESGSVTFDGGLIDFRDPCGAEWQATTKPALVFHRVPIACSSVVFTNGASLRGHMLRLQECGSTNILAFYGGDHCFDDVRIPCTWNQGFASETVADTTFRVADGATMSVGKVGIGTSTGSVGTENKTVHIVVEGEGTRVATSGNIENQGENGGGKGHAEVVVRDGAKLSVGDTFRMNYLPASTARVSVVDATLSVKTKFEFGQYASSRLDFVATNALILSPRCDLRSAGDVTLVDTVWTNCAALNLGGSPSCCNLPATVTVKGDRSRFGTTSADFRVGDMDHATLRIEGGTNVCKQLYLGGTASGNPGTGAAYSGTLEVTGGVFDLSVGDDTRTAYIGAGWGSYGTVNVSGGLLKSTSFFTGWCGAGEFNVSGGKVWATSEIRVGNQKKDTETRTTYFRISGGEVVVGIGLRLAVVEGRLGTLVMTGGRLRCNRVYGSAGTSGLEADGGVLAPSAATTTLLYGITDARLGPKGLTIDSAYDVTVSQVFANKAGVTDGALVLTGSGVKTLSAATSGEGRLVAAGGTTLLAPASGTAVTRADATVVVTNSATLNFASTVTAATFKSLELGSDETDGRLTLYTGTRLTVDSLALENFYLQLGNKFAVDTTYPIITVNGKVDAATVAAWKTAYILSGRSSNVCYAFEVSDYDPSSGTTVLSIVTSSPSVPSVVNAWQGAATGEAAWTNPANWSVATLDKTAIATFDSASESVAATVDLPEAAVIGAVAFANRDYTLAGTGPLVIADTQNGSVSVASGHPAIDVPLFLSGTLAVSVAAGASLAINEPIHHGGIVKTGDGALYLNGTGSVLEKGFTANGGLFSLGDMSVFAAVDGSPTSYLKDGTLRIGGDPEADEARLPFQLEIAAAANTSAVVISNAADAVLPDAVVTAGAIVKRGGGCLTFELPRQRTLSVGDGAATESAVPPADSLDFPADGTAPTAGYSGLTVVEGELRARTADGTASVMTADANNQVVLGTWSADAVAVPPMMTSDRAQFDTYYLYSGLNAYVGEYPENARTQYIRAVNGGTFKVNTLRVGQVADTAKSAYDTLLDIEADGGTFDCRSQGHVLRANARLALRAKNGGSLLFGTSPLTLSGPLTVDLTGGSRFGRSATEPMQINSSKAVDLTANVSGGSTFACWYLNWYNKCSKTWAFNFDNGLWSLGPSAPSKPIAFRVAEQVRFTALAGGMGFDVPSGITWQLYHPVYGVGGIFKRGAGTLRIEHAAAYKFDESALTNFTDSCVLRCAGTNRVEAGTLVATAGADGARFDLSSGATLEAEETVTGLTVSGAGTLAGGAFARLTLLETGTDVPTLDGIVATGRVKVDLGRDASRPLETLPQNLKVANLTANPSTVAKWKLAGTGLKGVRGEFRTTDDGVYLTVVRSGCIILLR